MKKTIFFLLLFLNVLSNAQQDAQYTQYMYNTIVVNPAYAGSREALSIFGMYRTQWVGLDGAPDTGIFSVNSPVSEQVGVGFSIINDRIAISDKTSLSADFAYSIPLSSNFRLSFGIKATAHVFSVDFSKLNVQPGDPNFENNIYSKLSPNFGAGIYLNSDKFYVGFSVPNLLESEHYDDEVKSVAVDRLHGYFISGYVFDFGESMKFKPATLIKAAEGAPLQVDLTGNFLFFDKFTLGAAYRWSGAISGLAGFQITDNWLLGYSYDSETTKLANYNSGSHEFFLRYEFSFNPKRVVSPRFF